MLEAGDEVAYYTTLKEEARPFYGVLYEDENVLFADKYAGVNSEALFCALAEAYGARLLFCERAGDVTDCYYYSPRLGGCVYIGGYAVNLHIALRGEGGCVGSPLIFGGY